MKQYVNLPEIKNEKIIPRNFGKIHHLFHSEMCSDDDVRVNMEMQTMFTLKKRKFSDVVIVTEKLDGSNMGIVKLNGVLYPINKSGYDCRNMGIRKSELQLLGESWATWLDVNYDFYDSIIGEGERLVYENCAIQHSLPYKFKKEPMFLLAKYTSDNKKVSYIELTKFAKQHNIQMPTLLSYGPAIQPELIISQYLSDIKSYRGGSFEGVVYNYEIDDRHETCAKMVCSDFVNKASNLDKFNKFKGSWM